MDRSKSTSIDISTQSAHSPSPPSDPSLLHAGNRVLRTVYLPSERADALLLTTQSLQQQVDDMRKLMDERAEVCVASVCVCACVCV